MSVLPFTTNRAIDLRALRASVVKEERIQAILDVTATVDQCHTAWASAPTGMAGDAYLKSLDKLICLLFEGVYPRASSPVPPIDIDALLVSRARLAEALTRLWLAYLDAPRELTKANVHDDPYKGRCRACAVVQGPR